MLRHFATLRSEEDGDESVLGEIRREAAPAVMNHTFPKTRFFRLHFVADNRAANYNNFDLIRPRSNLFGRNNAK